MINQEVLEKMKEQHKKAKILAKQSWEDGDHEGDINEQHYFEKGFVAGLACGLELEKE